MTDEVKVSEEAEKDIKVEGEEATTAEMEDEEVDEQLEAKLPFPTAAVVRIMKKNMDNEKMIKKEVKIAMNKWLGRLCESVSKEMNRVPYVMLHLHEFKSAIAMYENLAEFQKEKERILSHMATIKKDVEKLERDLGKFDEEILV